MGRPRVFHIVKDDWPTPAEAPDAAVPLQRSSLDQAEPAAPRCALTVDLEEWFSRPDLPPTRWGGLETRAAAATLRLLDLLATHGAHATFFILGRTADTHPGLVERILAAGHEVGSHGYDRRVVYRQYPEAFARSLDASLRALRRAGAPDVVSYRAPSFSITRRSLWAFDVLAAAGIQRDSSVMPARNPRYGIASAPLAPYRIQTTSDRAVLELPVSCLALGPGRLPFGGGCYLRLLPAALLRAAIRCTLRQGRPVVFYVHPWELDPARPRLRLPGHLAAACSYRLGSTERKLTALLSERTWTTLGEVAASCRDVRMTVPKWDGRGRPPIRPAPA